MFSYFVVRGQSMEPFVKERDFVFVLNVFFRPKRGDLVVLKDPQKSLLLVKRIGKIQGDMCWIEGDNTEASRDSRQFGWVPRKSIVGKAYVIHR